MQRGSMISDEVSKEKPNKVYYHPTNKPKLKE